MIPGFGHWKNTWNFNRGGSAQYVLSFVPLGDVHNLHNYGLCLVTDHSTMVMGEDPRTDVRGVAMPGADRGWIQVSTVFHKLKGRRKAAAFVPQRLRSSEHWNSSGKLTTAFPEPLISKKCPQYLSYTKRNHFWGSTKNSCPRLDRNLSSFKQHSWLMIKLIWGIVLHLLYYRCAKPMSPESLVNKRFTRRESTINSIISPIQSP